MHVAKPALCALDVLPLSLLCTESEQALILTMRKEKTTPLS